MKKELCKNDCTFLQSSLLSYILQSFLFNAADQVSQVGGAVQGDQAPGAFVAFQHINAGVVLLDLPEVAHVKTQKVADDGFVCIGWFYCVARASK